MLNVMPGGREGAWDGREFLARGVKAMVDSGIRQFLDLGSGLPTVRNTHEIAQELAPESRVLYVDNDPIVLAHGRALLAENERTTVVTADMGDPQALLASPEAKEHLALTRPVGVILLNVIHHVVDDGFAAATVQAYKDAVVPGSALLICHFCKSDDPEPAALEKVALEALGSGRFRTMGEIGAFFDGWELAEPGVAYPANWRPEGPVPDPLPINKRVAAGGLGFKR